MQEKKNYERQVLAGIEESLSKIIDLIPFGSIVLDVGCGSGMLGEYLSGKKGCIVDGVDLNVDAINIADGNYRTTFVLNLESEKLVEKFSNESYDFIVVADVIEHLVDPSALLDGVRSLIKSSGTIIFSVPNITHVSVGLELLLGQFNYSNNGLLDATHVRFFSKKSLLEKLSEHGLYAYSIDTIKKEIAHTEFSNISSKLFSDDFLKNIVTNHEDALTYQWIVSTKKVKDYSIDAVPLTAPNYRPPLIFTSELYWACLGEPQYTDTNKIIGRLIREDEEGQIIEFHFSDRLKLDDLSKIRIDPVSSKKIFLISHAEIIDTHKNVIWSWESNGDAFEIGGCNLLGFFEPGGCLFSPMDADPVWEPVLSKDILSAIQPGTIFRFRIKVDGALLNFLGNRLDQNLFGSSIRISELEGVLNSNSQYASFTESRIRNMIEKSEFLKNHEAALHHEIHLTHVRLGESHLAISSMTNSLSWKITLPLRFFGHYRRKFQKIKEKIEDLRKNLIAENHGFPYDKFLWALFFGGPGAFKTCLKYYDDLHKIIIDLKYRFHEGEVKFFPVSDLLKVCNPSNSVITSIIFDHNGGGGSNFYSRMLLKNLIEADKKVLRIFYYEKYYFLEYGNLNNYSIFYSDTVDKLFATLERLIIDKIIINSVYGCPDIDTLTSKIILLKNNKNIFLDIKVHDFLALCPSPHLMNSGGKYCHVPKDLDICTECLKSNKNWYHGWNTEDKIPKNITLWRKPFSDLIKAADKVDFFDESSVEILSRGIDLDFGKVELSPHQISHIICETPMELSGSLHIGILGTVSPVKGLEVIKMLGEYINFENIGIEISIIGNVTSTLPDFINVYGEYEYQNLPNIVQKLGVNVIFMASIVPETFSYTLSEAMQMKLPILSFDIGAQGNRVRQYLHGEVIPLGSGPITILQALQRLHCLNAKKGIT